MIEGGKADWNGGGFGEARCGTCIAFSFDCVCGGYCDAFGEFKIVGDTDTPCEKYTPTRVFKRPVQNKLSPKTERTTVKPTTMEEDNKETVETNESAYIHAMPPCLLRARDENSTVILEEWNDSTPQEPETHFCKIASITRECKSLKLEDLVVGILLEGDDGSQRFFEFHPGNPNISQVQHDGRVFRTASVDKVSRLTVLLSEK